ncbi:MAG: hypothetical protein HF308_05865 [Ignavibacteria bacterium]|nr:hypothetical protein [Ignavibacteria bacterium]MCU7520502.1 hypothetical protein [Ignavibacteria bacterium]MCU7523978.1 hypothetical protein [Ignavibacteria bacterium]
MFRIFLVLISFWVMFFNSNARPLKSSVDSGNVEVKGLVLKYVLIDTPYEMYQVIFSNSPYFTDSVYMKYGGSDSYEHIKWLKKCYESFLPEEKSKLKYIFDKAFEYWMMVETTKLDDDASLSEIIDCLTSPRIHYQNEIVKDSIREFLPYFYNNYLKDYLASNKKVFDDRALELMDQVRRNNSDILGFMEDVSGVSFRKKFNVCFYFTLRLIGADGFTKENTNISTLQRHIKDYSMLFGTPFHEFSHQLFQTFSRDSLFIKAAGTLKTDTKLFNYWDKQLQRKQYDWPGWCEENLVQGFAKYLYLKYYKKELDVKTYVYDDDFYNYLKKNNFDGKKMSLADVSIKFLESIGGK